MDLPKTIKIFGHDVQVRSDEECDKCEWWVCARIRPGDQRPFDVAQEDFCTKCGCAVWFDPRPKISKPPKICMECALKGPG